MTPARPHRRPPLWLPAGAAQINHPPPVGRLVAEMHAVWRVLDVEYPAELTDTDRQVWADAGSPDPAFPHKWTGWPYTVRVEWVAGEPAPGAGPGQTVRGDMRVPAGRWTGGHTWNLFPATGRWPQCSCCGGPMPCRAELLDRQVAAGLAEVDRHTRKMPGCCWACTEPITHRQKAVTYPGDNLDLPAGPAVQFHTRTQCLPAACEYEQRWILLDPRRERILTYPQCAGALVVHADGTSECLTAHSMIESLFDPGEHHCGPLNERDPNCRGHLTHDHSTHATCHSAVTWVRLPGDETYTCRRGCPTDQFHSTGATSPRPERRDRDRIC